MAVQTAQPALPTGSWVLDPARAAVAFSGRVSRLAPVFKAAFTKVTGCVVVGEATSMDIEVDVRSLTTGNRGWDDLLRSLDPFDAEHWPMATYSGSADLTVGSRVAVGGWLELRGVRQPVRLLAQLQPRGENEVVVTATGEVDRRAFGVRCDLPGIGRLVPAVMRLDITVTAVRTP